MYRLPTLRAVVFSVMCVCLAGWSPSSQARACPTYDFESLPLNNFIDGRDGWVDHPGQGQAYAGLDELGFNDTKVVRHLSTVVVNQSAYLTRVNDSAFGFVIHDGMSTPTIQFDMNGEHIAVLALGRDVDGDGMLEPGTGELGPSFGVWDRDFRVQGADLGTPSLAGFNEGGRGGNSGNDWYRLQLRMDPGANGGQGTGSLFYMNLTDGDAQFDPIIEFQDFDLELGRLVTDARPRYWNAIWLHLLTGGSNVPSADDLIPLVTVRGLEFLADKQTLSWRQTSGAGSYDVIRGSLAALRQTGGDTHLSFEDCLADETTATLLSDPEPAPTGGRFYLVRAVYEDGAPGTYDTGGMAQSSSRDPGLTQAPAGCP